MPRTWSLGSAVLLVAVASCSSCSRSPDPPPAILSFVATPSSISLGGRAVLSWTVSGANSIVIDQDIGSVAAISQTQVAPVSTTVYTMTATSSVGTVSKTVTVTVVGSCAPNCTNKTCGSDGCGGSCGTCSAPQACVSGTCSAPTCVPNQPCQPLYSCTTGITSCPTPFDTACTVTGNQPDGTSCGAAAVCSGGSCVPSTCVPGASCQPPNPCSDGALTCTSPSALATCTATTNKADGTSCGANQVCAAGRCLAAPNIVSFGASAPSACPGSAVTLTWSVQDATSLSIDQGVGAVTGTARTVTPSVTTTYTLTATNAAGSIQATTTVTVSTISKFVVFCGPSLEDDTILTSSSVSTSVDFAAGSGNPGRDVSWTVDPGSLGSVSPAVGPTTTYTAPGTPGTYIVRGTSTCDTSRSDWCRVYVVSPTSRAVSTLAGSAGVEGAADGAASAARFRLPRGIVVDSSGNVFIADTGNHTIRRLSNGQVTTIAGSAGATGGSDGVGAAARFNSPRAITVDAFGTLYVADQLNHTIRKITGNTVSTLAGSPGTYGASDGTGTGARFHSPSGVAVDSAGNVYVGDTDNHAIRKVTPAGVVTTFAGALGVPGSADGSGGAARFSSPFNVGLDAAGNLYVADAGNSTIRQITPAGVVTTVAGVALQPGSADGQGSAARFSSPKGLVVDSRGVAYVTEFPTNGTLGHTIRRISTSGVVDTYAGIVGRAGARDGDAAISLFDLPSAVGVDAFGYPPGLYVADGDNHTIRLVTAH